MATGANGQSISPKFLGLVSKAFRDKGLRLIWPVFLIDSKDHERFLEAKAELDALVRPLDGNESTR